MPRNHQGGIYDRLENGGAGGLSIRLGEILGGRGERRSNGQEYNGYGGGPGGERIRFTWKKLFVGAVVFVGLVWVVGPRMRRGWGANEHKSGTKGTGTIPLDIDSEPEPPSTYSYDIDSPPSSSSLSHSTDPDPLRTSHCSSPSSPSLPLVQYGLMIDAGSTGSRIHIYKFNNCLGTPSFEYEVFKMTQPGLSHYATTPSPSDAPPSEFAQRAAESLDTLLDEALRVVPKSLYHCTPVAVKATAGLRMLPGKRSEDILKQVDKRVREKYPFKLVDKDGVVVMDGKDEGVFAWITVNYLVGSIGHGKGAVAVGVEVEEEEGRKGKAEKKRAQTKETYAVLDLGGASTQIVFEPTFEQDDLAMEEGEHKYDLKFSGKKHVLYQHSYLGYGLMSARRHVHRLVEFMDSLRGGKENSIVGNPCLSKGTRRRVEVADERTGEKKNVTMAGEDVGSFDGCSRLMQLVLAKDAICELKPCSFDGVYQPTLLTSFSGKVLLLSYFYDRLHPLLPPSLPSPLTVSSIANVSRDVCQGRERWLDLWGAKPDVMKELEERPEYCLDLTFMYTLLRLGYEFEDEREVKLGKKIGGTELGWCLGAAINMVGAGELTCRA
ncbi:GDA1/CD39 (nucleoside phosphatase) family domain containing protein [Amanita muscaria]